MYSDRRLRSSNSDTGRMRQFDKASARVANRYPNSIARKLLLRRGTVVNVGYVRPLLCQVQGPRY
jgi:hypothetical protein